MSAIHIVNAADAAYVPHSAAMLHSLFTTNPGEAFAIHFLHRDGLQPEPIRQLAELCERHDASFSATAVSRQQLHGLPIAGQYPEEAWYRVVLPRLLPDVNRALWLDADLIVLSPIRELWQLDLQDLPIAACPNPMMFSARDIPTKLGIADRRRYFNTGVLLLNFQQMRNEDSETALRAAATRYAQWIRFADQDVLNAVYHERYVRLPLLWNVLAHAHVNVPESIRVHGIDEYRQAMATPRIVHFTGIAAMKPWTYRCSHPHRDTYLRHRALAGWQPPRYTDKNLRGFFLRLVPLRWRAVLRTFWYRRYREMLSYVVPVS